MGIKLPPDEYYKALSKVPTSGGAIIRNSKGEFLILKATYKEDWGIPGGMTELNETPYRSVIREVKEEINIEIQAPRLFAIDFATNAPWSRILFLFDCGVISEDEVSRIKLETDEIADFKFVKYEEALQLLSSNLKKRLSSSIEALKEKGFIYLENGEKLNK